MSVRACATRTAAVALSAVAVLGMAAPAAADHQRGHSGGLCADGRAPYPPGLCGGGQGGPGRAPGSGQNPGLGASGSTADADRNGTADLTTSARSVATEGAVTVVSEGWEPLGDVNLFILSTPTFLGTFKADAAGIMRTTVQLPAGVEAGAHHIVATGRAVDGSIRTLNVPIKVTSAGAATRASVARNSIAGVALPRTGADVAAVAAVGAGVVLVGAGAVYAGRRRRSTV